jgi:hypothetical protein
MPSHGRCRWSGRTCGEVEVDEITMAGKATPGSLKVVNGEVVLTSKPDSAQLLTPAD